MFLTPFVPANAGARPDRGVECWPIERSMPCGYIPQLHTSADWDTVPAAAYSNRGGAISVLFDEERVPPAEAGRISIS
jgi:hypothetical protein